MDRGLVQRAIRLALVPLPLVRGPAVVRPFPGPSSCWSGAWPSG